MTKDDEKRISSIQQGMSNNEGGFSALEEILPVCPMVQFELIDVISKAIPFDLLQFLVRYSLFNHPLFFTLPYTATPQGKAEAFPGADSEWFQGRLEGR